MHYLRRAEAFQGEKNTLRKQLMLGTERTQVHWQEWRMSRQEADLAIHLCWVTLQTSVKYGHWLLSSRGMI